MFGGNARDECLPSRRRRAAGCTIEGRQRRGPPGAGAVRSGPAAAAAMPTTGPTAGEQPERLTTRRRPWAWCSAAAHTPAPGHAPASRGAPGRRAGSVESWGGATAGVGPERRKEARQRGRKGGSSGMVDRMQRTAVAVVLLTLWGGSLGFLRRHLFYGVWSTLALASLMSGEQLTIGRLYKFDIGRSINFYVLF